MIGSAPEELREQFAGLSTLKKARKAARLRPGPKSDTVVGATKLALKKLAQRMLAARDEVADLDPHIARLVKATAPKAARASRHRHADCRGAAGHRRRQPRPAQVRRAFAHLTGTAPLPASSGKVVKYRLNRGGDRQANWALHMIAVARCPHDERTRAYVRSRSPDGKANLDILRRLKRYIAREVFKILHDTLDQPGALPEAA